MLNEILVPTIVLLSMGIFLGLALGIADKYLKVEMDARLETLIKLLPGFNCGACGNPGCAGQAAAILDGTAKIRGCKPMKDEQEVAIREYLKTAEGPDGHLVDLSKA